MLVNIFALKRTFLTVLFVLLICMAGLTFAQTEQFGKASYYADRFEGRQTASGEIFFQDSLTAAHPTIPFNTKVKVTNVKTDQSVIVRINDRGPLVPGRIIDLSRKAMEKLNGIFTGVIEVRIDELNDQ